VKRRQRKSLFSDLLIHMVTVDGLDESKVPMNQRCGPASKVIARLTEEIRPSLADIRNDSAHGAPFDGFPWAGLLELVRDLVDYRTGTGLCARMSMEGTMFVIVCKPIQEKGSFKAYSNRTDARTYADFQVLLGEGVDRAESYEVPGVDDARKAIAAVERGEGKLIYVGVLRATTREIREAQMTDIKNALAGCQTFGEAVAKFNAMAPKGGQAAKGGVTACYSESETPPPAVSDPAPEPPPEENTSAGALS
jgi:hypothetical protein